MISSVSYPNQNRNYCLFDQARVDLKKKDLFLIKNTLETSDSEDEILESLYAINLIIDEDKNNIDKVKELYPSLARFNNSDSPNVQTFLAGIYRKIKVPDAFGPLWAMLIRNSINPPKDCPFDPNEEIGGAILDYLA